MIPALDAGIDYQSSADVPAWSNPGDLMADRGEKALEAGCDVYMSKPINIRELWARVEAFIPTP